MAMSEILLIGLFGDWWWWAFCLKLQRTIFLFLLWIYEWIESNQDSLEDYEWAFQYNLLEMFCRQLVIRKVVEKIWTMHKLLFYFLSKNCLDVTSSQIIWTSIPLSENSRITVTFFFPSWAICFVTNLLSPSLVTVVLHLRPSVVVSSNSFP